ncbi:MAG: hypothetical protein V4591_07385 [Bdellovibrionota bacterium]
MSITMRPVIRFLVRFFVKHVLKFTPAILRAVEAVVRARTENRVLQSCGFVKKIFFVSMNGAEFSHGGFSIMIKSSSVRQTSTSVKAHKLNDIEKENESNNAENNKSNFFCRGVSKKDSQLVKNGKPEADQSKSKSSIKEMLFDVATNAVKPFVREPKGSTCSGLLK